jgi:uncharacterized lipoprotein YbaY
MAFSRGFWLVRLALLVGGLAGCAAEPGQPVSPAQRFTLLEHVQVVGACVLESGSVSARYAGFVERWRDVKRGRDLLHGSVSTVDRFVDPGRAGNRPPLSIQFGEIDVAPLTAGQLVLTGVSEGSQPSRATCTLDVIAREQPARPEGRLLASLLGREPVSLPPRSVLSGAALLIGLVAGIRLIRHQVRRTSASWLLGLALLLQLISLLLG